MRIAMPPVSPSRLSLVLALLLAPLAAQTPMARLEGRVQDPCSRPVANAEVTVEHDGEVIARTRSDGEGAFVLGRLPRQELTVRATTAAPDLGACRIDLREDARGFVHIVVMPARLVTGTVHDASGQPIAEAWIASVPTGAAEFSVFGSHTRSDAQGRFALTHVPFGANAVRVWAAGYAGFAASIDGNGNPTVAAILGRDEPSGWWKIECPERAEGSECWVSGSAQYTRAENGAAAPTAAALPTSAPSDPAPGTGLAPGTGSFARR